MYSHPLFKIQDAQELNDPTKDSKTWVKYLYKTISSLNSKRLKRLGMTPAKVVKLASVELKLKPYSDEKLLPTDWLYRYLLQPGEEHGDQKRRATDMN